MVANLARVMRERYIAHPRHGPLPGLLLVLTVVSGLVDAVSILRMDRVFVANMTGNIVFVGFGVAGAAGFSVTAALVALVGFACGAALTGALPADWRSDRPRLLRTAAVVKLACALPVVALGVALGISPGRPITYLFIALLAASMGVQNATVRLLAVPDLTTTVVTTTLTGLVHDLRARGWRDPVIGNRAASIVFLFLGAVIGGVLVLQVSPAASLTLGALLLAFVGVVGHLAASRGVTWGAYP